MDPVISLKGLLWEKAETRHSELELSFSLWGSGVGQKDPQGSPRRLCCKATPTHKPDWPHLNLGFGEGKESLSILDEGKLWPAQRHLLKLQEDLISKNNSKKQQSLTLCLSSNITGRYHLFLERWHLWKSSDAKSMLSSL